jgi:hypothetical protein
MLSYNQKLVEKLRHIYIKIEKSSGLHFANTNIKHYTGGKAVEIKRI